MALPSAAQRLVEAETALHSILTGRGIQSIRDSNGEAVTYSTANVSRLRAYIAELKAEIAGAVSNYGSGPIRPRFL